MNYREYKNLSAERATVRTLIERLSPSAIIDRATMQARLDKLDEQLASAKQAPRPPASARITFRGRPVIASQGVFAEFGTQAMAAFAETVAVLAASQGGRLAGMGPLPNREQHQLLITGTARGSFGFEVEERQSEPSLFNDETTLAVALAQSAELLHSVAGTDDELTEAVAGIDQRVIRSLKELLEVLARNEAVCSLEFRGHSVGFRDVAQVRAAVNRLAQDNIHEEEQWYYGEFQGVLPLRRTFEFKVAADEQVIHGKIGAEIADPAELNRHLRQPTKIVLVATRVGAGRTKYVLRDMPSWNATLAQ